MNKLILFFLLTASLLLAQTSNLPSAPQAKKPAGATGTGTRVPSKDEVEAALKRTVGYDPGVAWTVTSFQYWVYASLGPRGPAGP